MKKHNFNAGPAILPQSVMTEAAQAVTDFNGNGLSILEISHRDKAFISVMDEAQQLVVELLGLDDSYAVLFLSGGTATTGNRYAMLAEVQFTYDEKRRGYTQYYW